MNAFICHTLMMLEDVGMSVEYPHIQHITVDENGKCAIHSNLSLMQGKRVSIEQNTRLKFLILFVLLDAHLDATYPKMEGESYHKKCENIPDESEYDFILKQVFRVAKVIRNALVHNQSLFCITSNGVHVDYKRGKSHFCLNMSREAFNDLLTAIVMYIKGDMGKGNYFLGIVRSIYTDIRTGITQFEDEFSRMLEPSREGIKLNWRMRQFVQNPPYNCISDVIRFIYEVNKIPRGEGADSPYYEINPDFCIIYKNEKFLVPREALDHELSIKKYDLITDWKKEDSWPPNNM